MSAGGLAQPLCELLVPLVPESRDAARQGLPGFRRSIVTARLDVRLFDAITPALTTVVNLVPSIPLVDSSITTAFPFVANAPRGPRPRRR